MVAVSNADRIVFPEIGKTKGDVVAYFERVAERMLPHVIDRPVSIVRYPKGLSARGFFQKNAPAHFPESFGRLSIPRSDEASRRHRDPDARERNVTVYPIVREAEHLPYLANQGAIEIHVPTARASSLMRPDRFVIDLDPPPGAVPLVRRAARIVRDELARLGVETAPMATGSKGYHVVANIEPSLDVGELGLALHQLAAILVARYPDDLTLVFRVAKRGGKAFVDWLRNHPLATVVAPYSLRGKPRATVAAPIAWNELDELAPDAFTIDDVDRLLDRPDTLAALGRSDPHAFASAVNAEFEASGLELETVDRFRR